MGRTVVLDGQEGEVTIANAPKLITDADRKKRAEAARVLADARETFGGGRPRKILECKAGQVGKWCRCADCRKAEYAKRTEKRREAKQRKLDEMDPFA